MAVYSVGGSPVQTVYGLNGSASDAFNVSGSLIHTNGVDYSNYSFVQKWASKGVSSAQGFDVYDGKVFWISKSGNASVPADCYVWNLSDGSQALSSPYITVYSGHGNNLSFDFPTLYATPAYPPSTAYINTLSGAYSASLTKTLVFDDGSTDCDACIDESDATKLWTIGHTAGSSDRSAPFKLSLWDLSNQTDNGDGTYTPTLIRSVSVAQPESSYFFQGCKFHDGVFWFASGYGGGGTSAYIFGVDPNTGAYLYTIDCETTEEPEGIAWVEDANEHGGYALYVGFAGMMLRKYSFTAG